MNYRIVFAPSFEDAVQAKIDWLRGEHVSEHRIEIWLGKLYKKLLGIETYPRLHPVDEAYSAEVGRVSHKINFQKYLVFYQVDDDRREINVVGFIDGAARSK